MASKISVNRNIRTRCEICSKLTIKTPEWCHWRSPDVFIVHFEHFTPCSSVSNVNFEHVTTGWAVSIPVILLKIALKPHVLKKQVENQVLFKNTHFMYRLMLFLCMLLHFGLYLYKSTLFIISSFSTAFLTVIK